VQRLSTPHFAAPSLQLASAAIPPAVPPSFAGIRSESPGMWPEWHTVHGLQPALRACALAVFSPTCAIDAAACPLEASRPGPKSCSNIKKVVGVACGHGACALGNSVQILRVSCSITVLPTECACRAARERPAVCSSKCQKEGGAELHALQPPPGGRGLPRQGPRCPGSWPFWQLQTPNASEP
jgi:hypothetical protein